MIRGINDLEVSGKVVFVRCDLNVPLEDGQITDDGRIRASLATLTNLRDRAHGTLKFHHRELNLDAKDLENLRL